MSSQQTTFPGFIDCHVHFREPGLTHKATIESESRAAKVGGVTCVCEMPNTVPPTVTVDAFRDKVERARSAPIDVRFFFGATQDSHLEELRRLLTDDALVDLRARCCGLKLYLDHSTGNQKAEGAVIESAFKLCAEHSLPIVAHCEDPATNAASSSHGDATDPASHSLRRPPEAEAKAIEYAIGLARMHGALLHIAHLSTEDGLALVRRAKDERIAVTCEVSPHHLFLTIADYAWLHMRGKMNPPLRSLDDARALWAGIADGTVDCVSTDHAPHLLSEKEGKDLSTSASGVPGVATMIPLLLTVAAGGWPHPSEPALGTLTHDDIVRLCFTNPNHIFRLGKDRDAERITVHLGESWIIRAADIPSICGWTPYEGWNVTGKIL
jgi:dihydroorotase